MTSITEMRTLEGRELIAWLESPEGEAWSRANHISATRYSHAMLVDVKDDHPAKCPGDGSDIQRPNQWGPEILSDIACYGISGLPQAR